MMVELTAELQARLDEAAAISCRSAAGLLHDALEAYLDDLATVRQTLDARYAEIKSGRVRPLDGEAFFEELRRVKKNGFAARHEYRPGI